jgi:hypothetical protein
VEVAPEAQRRGGARGCAGGAGFAIGGAGFEPWVALGGLDDRIPPTKRISS